ncbi:hypothetical protein DL771_002072 [Monosporascus sp. 5C6A]|nr:hypothetical protein DL771_002072 [Monosporascus sp. 5C6A]
MANFDSNRWYLITNADEGLSIVGTETVLTDDTTSVQPYGAVFLRLSNTSDIQQQWQIFRINDTIVLRCRSCGPDAYMGTATHLQAESDLLVAGNTKPIMGGARALGVAALWELGNWQDGYYWMENAANGSAWHLNQTGGFLTMSSNITATQPQQRFQFRQQGEINDAGYSTIDVRFTNGIFHLEPSGNCNAHSY